MNIGFEAKRFFNNFTGLGNYSRFIVSALSQHYHDNQYYLYTPTLRKNPEVGAILQHKNIHVVSPPARYLRFHAASLWRTWGMVNEPTTQNLRIFHGLSQELPMGLPSTLQKVVTVHDLIFLRYPEFYNSIDIAIYKAKVKFACRNSDRIIAISDQTADDIVEYLKIDRSKIQVIYQGCHPSFRKVWDENEIAFVRMKYRLPKEYLLNVGTLEERKNALILVKALLCIPENSRIPIVFVGRPTKRYVAIIKRFVTENRLEKWVTFLHDVSFTDLPCLYQGANTFIYPSLFEGFGIPILEAIESRVPVITSTGSCFQEAGGPQTIYVDPGNAETLAESIQKVSEDAVLRERMVKESTQYIQRFQPGIIARELWEMYSAL